MFKGDLSKIPKCNTNDDVLNFIDNEFMIEEEKIKKLAFKYFHTGSHDVAYMELRPAVFFIHESDLHRIRIISQSPNKNFV